MVKKIGVLHIACNTPTFFYFTNNPSTSTFFSIMPEATKKSWVFFKEAMASGIHFFDGFRFQFRGLGSHFQGFVRILLHEVQGFFLDG